MLKLTLQWKSSEFLHWLRHEGTGTSPASLVSVSLRMFTPRAPAMFMSLVTVWPASDVSGGRGDTDTEHWALPGLLTSALNVAYSEADGGCR